MHKKEEKKIVKMQKCWLRDGKKREEKRNKRKYEVTKNIIVKEMKI